ncbi:MAG: hypothetical protein AMXMBFR4_29380 [Candidatus Hydrogenedentota bacterium]
MHAVFYEQAIRECSARAGVVHSAMSSFIILGVVNRILMAKIDLKSGRRFADVVKQSRVPCPVGGIETSGELRRAGSDVSQVLLERLPLVDGAAGR